MMTKKDKLENDKYDKHGNTICNELSTLFNPNQTLQTIAESPIVLSHNSRASILPKLIKHKSLLSANQLKYKKIKQTTFEGVGGAYTPNLVSFWDHSGCLESTHFDAALRGATDRYDLLLR